MKSNQNKNTLAAWSYSDELIPTLYVQGDITTNGEKPVVHLIEKDENKKDDDLMLMFSPDVYAPDGTGSLTIQNFEKKIRGVNEYKTVTIISKNGKIILEVEVRTHSKKEQKISE